MKYQIVYDKPGRLRVRFGKYMFTETQGYGLREMLGKIEGVNHIIANHINGSILAVYETEEAREGVLKNLSAFKREALFDGEPTEEEKAKKIEAKFRKKFVIHCTKYYGSKLIFPMPVRNVFTCFKALFYLKLGVESISQAKLNVELLDATAIGAAVLSRHFTTASSTMFLLKLSDILLEYSNKRAKHALAQSLAINIEKVWVVNAGQEIETLMKDLAVGDIVRIRKGSMIPIDGTIVSGDALINESSMTGEPIPIHKTVKGTVFAGTILEDGEIDVAVLNLKNESRIAKIIEMIDTGENEKANVQGKAERMADDIVPVSFGLFLLTLLLTRNVPRALSVLMVDFSCAIKLTTPITVISALRESVNKDILVKGGKYLEVLSNVDTVVFDKTGTLTNAVPKVSNIIVMDNTYTEDKVLKIAACLEEHFPHSVAASIVAEAKKKDLVHPEDHGKVEYLVAHGIASSHEGSRTIIGSKHFVFEDEHVPYPQEQGDWLNEKIGSDSAVYLAVDQKLVGVICVNDPPRDDAELTVELLRKEGIKNIIMITGDSEGSAKYISNKLGLDGYYASILPDGKAHIIEELKSEGKTVLMVGDGINDTPALSCADVSLTLNGSSDIAREVADISILSDDLTKIIVARKLAIGLMKKIHNQYSFIVAFNTMLIGLGTFGIISVDRSALYHNLSTIAIAGGSAKHILKEESLLAEGKKENETT